MRKPKVSVLIPVYNRANFIAACIQSVLDQDFPDLEVVIVDNVSTDDTWNICKKIASEDSRVRIFQNDENIGPVRNWIRCAQEAKGEYAKILFSDDILLPNCLSLMTGKMRNPDIGLVYCAVLLGESIEGASVLFKNHSGVLSSTCYPSMMSSGKVPVSPSAVLLRTQDLLNSLKPEIPTARPHRFDMHGAGPDMMISLMTARSYPLVESVSQPLVFFRAHAGSISSINENGEVSDGYQAAYSYYFRKYESHQKWLRYVSRRWAINVRRRRRWIGLRNFLVSHEGSGSFFETASALIYAIYYAVR
jgi:glycosyltransferase involved in cell wall biosynthesis